MLQFGVMTGTLISISRSNRPGRSAQVDRSRRRHGPSLEPPAVALFGQRLQALASRQLAREKGLAIIFVTHDLRLTERCADRIAFLVNGAVVEEGSVDQILNHPVTPEVRSFLSLDLLNEAEVTA